MWEVQKKKKKLVELNGFKIFLSLAGIRGCDHLHLVYRITAMVSYLLRDYWLKETKDY